MTNEIMRWLPALPPQGSVLATARAGLLRVWVPCRGPLSAYVARSPLSPWLLRLSCCTSARHSCCAVCVWPGDWLDSPPGSIWACFSVTVAAVWTPLYSHLCVRVAVAFSLRLDNVCFRLLGNPLTAFLQDTFVAHLLCTRPVLSRAACCCVSHDTNACVCVVHRTCARDAAAALCSPSTRCAFEICGCCALLGRGVPRLSPVCWHPAVFFHWVLAFWGSLWGVVVVGSMSCVWRRTVPCVLPWLVQRLEQAQACRAPPVRCVVT